MKTSLQSLGSQYPNFNKMYDNPDLDCIKITNDITFFSTKPVIRVVGWSMVGVEVSLNLAQYMVTRVGKDDLFSDIIDQYEVHVLFGKGIPMGSTSSTTPCSGDAVVEDKALGQAVRRWSNTEGGSWEIFEVDFVSGW